MIRTILYSPSTRVARTGNEELLAIWQQQHEALLRADIADNAPETEQQIGLRAVDWSP
jgi:hypothetical protein